jgi:hypothetical protein
LSKSTLFKKEIISKTKNAEAAKIVQPVQVGQTTKVNELVFFIKPELLKVEDQDKLQNALDLVAEKFKAFDVTVSGGAIVPGMVLEKYEIMNRHYGFINQLSRKASEIVDADTRKEIFKQLDISDPENYQILGGHEFLEQFDTDIETLSKTWFGQEANKLRSGFYFVAHSFQDQKIILVNGFHPSQLKHFTRKDHQIYLMLLHSDTDWEKLKFDMVGDTFPERAKEGSIRGILYADPKKFGQREVGINTNGVHLSAGPFEAAFEVVNFFGDLIDLDPTETPPLAIKKAREAGLSEEKTLKLLNNPEINGSDLFSATENLNTDAAVELAKNAFGYPA